MTSTAPTTPMTLSILIEASATIIVQIAPINEFLASNMHLHLHLLIIEWQSIISTKPPPKWIRGIKVSASTKG